MAVAIKVRPIGYLEPPRRRGSKSSTWFYQVGNGYTILVLMSTDCLNRIRQTADSVPHLMKLLNQRQVQAVLQNR